MTEDKMVEWPPNFNGHEFEQTPGDSEGQRSLACYSQWDHRVRHSSATEQQQYIIIIWASPVAHR